MKPIEGMTLKFNIKNSFLTGKLATAYRDKNGLWYVVWLVDGVESVHGPNSGLTDDGIHKCWEVVNDGIHSCRESKKNIRDDLYCSCLNPNVVERSIGHIRFDYCLICKKERK